MSAPFDDSQRQAWKRAYQLFGVPELASPFVIKQAYRRMIRRWHPDKASNQGANELDATRMSQLINDAYAEIAEAPLRYRSSSAGLDERVAPASPSPPTADDSLEKPLWLPRPEQMEFWVRLICGGVFGAMLGAVTSMGLAVHFRESVLAVSLGTIACAYGAIRYGDKFWYWIFGKSWLLW